MPNGGRRGIFSVQDQLWRTVRVQPLAENGVAKAEQNCGQRHAVPKKRPTPNPGGQSGERQREHGYQEIAGRAVG